jgi:hypothetical protein
MLNQPPTSSFYIFVYTFLHELRSNQQNRISIFLVSLDEHTNMRTAAVVVVVVVVRVCEGGGSCLPQSVA